MNQLSNPQDSSLSKILVQLDPDRHPSVFDAVVAIDAGVDRLLPYGNVTCDVVTGLTHGTIFTRGVDDLRRTAIFIGGSDVKQGEALLASVLKTFFGPMRVSVMLDANGANTTAAAAVIAARRHLSLSGISTLVLAATGSVGQRIVRLLASEGAHVGIGSRSLARAEELKQSILATHPHAELTPIEMGQLRSLANSFPKVELVIAAGAAGIELLPNEMWVTNSDLKVVVDLNAVPPLGIHGVEPFDKGKERHGKIAYGAIGVGGTKMKIHRAAIQRLFEANHHVLDVDAIYQLGLELEAR